MISIQSSDNILSRTLHLQDKKADGILTEASKEMDEIGKKLEEELQIEGVREYFNNAYEAFLDSEEIKKVADDTDKLKKEAFAAAAAGVLRSIGGFIAKNPQIAIQILSTVGSTLGSLGFTQSQSSIETASGQVTQEMEQRTQQQEQQQDAMEQQGQPEVAPEQPM